MVLWLSSPGRAAHGDGGEPAGTRFGVHRDIVPRETFGTLVDLQEAYARAQSDRDALLDAARHEAEHLAARVVLRHAGFAGAQHDDTPLERQGFSGFDGERPAFEWPVPTLGEHNELLRKTED